MRVPKEISPPHPRAGLAEILSAIFLLFSSIPGTSHLQLVTGLAGEGEWERNLSFPFPKPCFSPEEQAQD